jgi:membrane protease YdiL (CAAX protease family)
MPEEYGTALVLRPLLIWQAGFFFGVPTILLVLSVYCLVPRLLAWGFSAYVSLDSAFLVPLALLFSASLVAYRLEGHAWTWAALKDRFRLRRMDGDDWLWTGGLLVFALVTYFPLRAITVRLIGEGVIPLPASLPTILDPRAKQSVEVLMGGQVKGNWPLALVNLSALFFNTFGEEFWWRGYILPRQEVAHGRRAWVVHGLLWTLFHAFKYWECVALLPTCLAFSFVAQRRKSTWPGIVTHSALNGLESISVLLLVLGAIQV